jgi:WhiB family redox-sensing transcriptional regulator
VRLDEQLAWEALLQPGHAAFDLLLEASRNRPAWMDRGACRDHPEVDVFPAAPARGIAPDVGPALAICAGCPVVYECREFAEENAEYGIWGASTPRQRRARSAA